MNILISGGCKNGKSLHAQKLVRDMAKEAEVPMYYIATMIPHDEEDRHRIEKHLEARAGWGFQTVEQPTNLLALLDREDVNPEGAFLMDSVTALLSNEMFRDDGSIDEEAGARLREEVVAFAEKTGRTVFVSDGIYSDARHYDPLTENYRRSLADCDRALAEVCDEVIDATFGVFQKIKEGSK